MDWWRILSFLLAQSRRKGGTVSRLDYFTDRPVRYLASRGASPGEMDVWGTGHCVGTSDRDPDCVLLVAPYGDFGEVLLPAEEVRVARASHRPVEVLVGVVEFPVV